MDSTIFRQWFYEKFVPFCHKALRDKRVPQKAILLMDNAPSNPDVENLSSEDGLITCAYLPPNTTSVIQPMDQGVLENIKRRYKMDLLLRHLNENDLGRNTVDFIKSLNIKDAVLMAAKSWDDVEERTIVRSWNKLWPIESESAVAETGQPDVESLFDQMDIPSEEGAAWLTADNEDTG